MPSIRLSIFVFNCLATMRLVTSLVRIAPVKTQAASIALEEEKNTLQSGVNASSVASGEVKVTLKSGANVVGTWFDGVPVYFGIRYAKAARFEAPVSWVPEGNSTYDAVADGSACPQPKYLGTAASYEEDCLYLNVWTPSVLKPNTSSLKPVMFWIHGGALMFGSSHSSVIGFSNLVKEHQVLVVVINYRLNVFGFFTPSDPVAPKNFGLWDQLEALRWVQAHIQDFGGDPNSVTIFGHSAGGLSVMALYKSPRAKGLFHRAISQSPGFLRPGQFQRHWTEAASTMGQKCLNAAGCDSVQCMKKLSVEKLLNMCADYTDTAASAPGTGMIFAGYDGDLLTGPLYSSRSCGNSSAPPGSAVPLMIGGLTHEWRYFALLTSARRFVGTFLSEYLTGYKEGHSQLQNCALDKLRTYFSNASRFNCWMCPFLGDPAFVEFAGVLAFLLDPRLFASEYGGPRYRYLLDIDGRGLFGGAHAVDKCYITDAMTARPIALKYKVLCGSWDERQQDLARMLRQYWASFAKSGVPADDHGPRWDPVDPHSGLLGLPVMHFDLKGTSHLSYSAWPTNQSAQMLSDMMCGRLELQARPASSLSTTCEISKARGM